MNTDLDTTYDFDVVRHRSGWEWRVRASSSGKLLMHGHAAQRVAARYAGYRALLLLLAAAPPRPKAAAIDPLFARADAAIAEACRLRLERQAAAQWVQATRRALAQSIRRALVQRAAQI